MTEEEEEDDSDKARRLPNNSAASAPPFSDQVLENVLESVLQFITSPRDRNACSLVCRWWHRTEALTRQHLSVGNLYSVNPTRAVTRFPYIQSLSLKGRPRFADFGLVPRGWGAGFTAWAKALAAGLCAGSIKKLVLKRITVSNSDLELIGRALPNFGDLTLICCEGFGTPGLGALVENCKLLRVLDLIDSDVEDDTSDDMALVDWISKFSRTHNCLESLSFECVRYPVNLHSLGSLIGRSPNLRRLRVNHHISIGQLCRLLLRAPQLSHVGTGVFCSLNEDEELEIKEVEAAFGYLKELICLSGFRDLKPDLLPAIYPICGQLTSLNLSYTDISAEQLEPLIRHCHNLQIFWALDSIGDDGLKAVAATCKDLRELRVFPLDPSEESEGSVSDLGLIYISEGCRKLQSILYFCQRMTNAAVIAMSVNCPDLAVFRLCIMGRHTTDYSTGGPMDEGFGAIVMNCKKLHRLAVSGLLTDGAFERFGKYGKTIRTHSIAFGGDSDLGLKFVLEGCSNMQKLEIRDSPFGDAGLLAGIGHFYNMRFVWLSSCRLTVRGCREVARRLPHMVVEVIGDPLIGSPVLDDNDPVDKLYMYRSLAGPREDVPQFVKIL